MAKKKYSINWENDEPVSFEVDGVTYNSLDDVPSEKDRKKNGIIGKENLLPFIQPGQRRQEA